MIKNPEKYDKIREYLRKMGQNVTVFEEMRHFQK